MKPPKILWAGLCALFLTASGARAQSTITLHLTGSTAFRTAVQTAILHILSGTPAVAFVGSSYGGASEAIITGTTNSNINGGPATVTIKTYWSGSLAGIETVSQQIPLANFLANTNSTSGGTNTALAGGCAGSLHVRRIPSHLAICASAVSRIAAPTRRRGQLQVHQE
jgi:hypothetical protein